MAVVMQEPLDPKKDPTDLQMPLIPELVATPQPESDAPRPSPRCAYDGEGHDASVCPMIDNGGVKRQYPPLDQISCGFCFRIGHWAPACPTDTTSDLPPIIPPARGTAGRGASGFGASGSRDVAEPVNGQVAAQLWAELSPHPRECGLAGKRFVELVDRIGKDPEVLLYAICEHAQAGHHAAAITEEKMRSRMARINEEQREEEKRMERDESTRMRGLRPLRSALDAMIQRLQQP